MHRNVNTPHAHIEDAPFTQVLSTTLSADECATLIRKMRTGFHAGGGVNKWSGGCRISPGLRASIPDRGALTYYFANLLPETA